MSLRNVRKERPENSRRRSEEERRKMRRESKGMS
jgi:hypothetical protein